MQNRARKGKEWIYQSSPFFKKRENLHLSSHFPLAFKMHLALVVSKQVDVKTFFFSGRLLVTGK